MSWSGTVRCGFCGEEGHNQRTCERRHEWLATSAESGALWAIQELAAEEKKKKAVRRCKWCGQPGHNQRTCPVKKYVNSRIPRAKELYEKILRATHGARWGKGTFIKATEQYRENESAIVTGLSKRADIGGMAPYEQVREKLYNGADLSHAFGEFEHVKWRLQNALSCQLLVRTTSGQDQWVTPPMTEYEIPQLGVCVGGFASKIDITAAVPDRGNTPVSVRFNIEPSTTKEEIDADIEWLEYISENVRATNAQI